MCRDPESTTPFFRSLWCGGAGCWCLASLTRFMRASFHAYTPLLHLLPTFPSFKHRTLRFRFDRVPFCTGNTRPQGKREEGARHVRGDTTLPDGPRFGRRGGPAGQRGLRAPHQRHAGVRGVFRAERRAGGVRFGERLRRPAERGGEQQGSRRLGEPEPQRAAPDPAGLRGRRGGGVQGEVGQAEHPEVRLLGSGHRPSASGGVNKRWTTMVGRIAVSTTTVTST